MSETSEYRELGAGTLWNPARNRRGPHGPYAPPPLTPIPAPTPHNPAPGAIPQPVPVSVNTTSPVLHYLNDPTTPELVENVCVPAMPPLRLSVHKFVGGGVQPGTAEAHAANVYISMVNTINYVSRFSPRPLARWAVTESLHVLPRAGEQANAFYNRTGISFFFFRHDNKLVYTCESGDVIAHELGHALLDVLRPNLWGVASLEIWAFHEAFGDCVAMLHLMQYDAVLEHVLRETGGDMRKSNVISRIGEEMGRGLGRPLTLRDACNDFVYVPPETLPKHNPNGLAQESHSFSRVFSGAWYDVLAGIYEKEPGDRLAALRKARDVACSYLLNAANVAAAVPKFFDAVAQAMLAVDANNGFSYKDVLNFVFLRRKLITEQVRILSSVRPEEVAADLKADDGLLQGEVTALCVDGIRRVRLADALGIAAQSDNPLYQAEVEIPDGSFYQFESGVLTNEVRCSREEALDAAAACLTYLHEENLVGPGNDTPWEVVDGRLVRTFCTCDGFLNNSQIKGAPEYGKPWKAANNAGCCGNCRPKPEQVSTPVKLGCYIRQQTGAAATVERSGRVIRQKVC